MKFPKWLQDRLVFKMPSKEDYNSVPELAEIQYPLTKCEDCDLQVGKRTVNYKKNHQPFTHWKATCSECKLCADPSTGKFTVTTTEHRSQLFRIKRELDQKDK